MATTGYDDRIFLVEVSGLRQQSVMSTSHYTFKVPYRSLARTLQFVSRNGGTVVRIRTLSLSLPIQDLWNSAATLDNQDVDVIAADPSPDLDADLKPALPSETLADGEAAHSSVLAEREEPPSPLPSETERLESSKLLRLIRGFLKKLNHALAGSD